MHGRDDQHSRRLRQCLASLPGHRKRRPRLVELLRRRGTHRQGRSLHRPRMLWRNRDDARPRRWHRRFPGVRDGHRIRRVRADQLFHRRAAAQGRPLLEPRLHQQHRFDDRDRQRTLGDDRRGRTRSDQLSGPGFFPRGGPLRRHRMHERFHDSRGPGCERTFFDCPGGRRAPAHRVLRGGDRRDAENGAPGAAGRLRRRRAAGPGLAARRDGREPRLVHGRSGPVELRRSRTRRRWPTPTGVWSGPATSTTTRTPICCGGTSDPARTWSGS